MPSVKHICRAAVLVGLASLASIASIVLLPTAARAYEEMRTGGPPSEYVSFLKMKAMQAMHMMDAGQKGSVTKEKFIKFHQEMFDRMDKDHDGKLTPEEWLGRPPKKSDG